MGSIPGSVSSVVEHIAISAEGVGSIPGSTSSVVEHIAISAGGVGSIPEPVKSTQCRGRLATAAMFLRSCVAQALNRGDGSRYSLHTST